MRRMMRFASSGNGEPRKAYSPPAANAVEKKYCLSVGPKVGSDVRPGKERPPLASTP